MARAIQMKGSLELSVTKQSPTFRPARRNSLKKHKKLIVQNENNDTNNKSPAVKASASSSKKIIQPSA